MIPTYNQAAYVEAAIASALAQDYDNLEVILADDASTDDTPNIVGRFLSDVRFRYVRNACNLGRVANYRRTLYEHASGDWVLNLDGDDYLLANDFLRGVMAHVTHCAQTVLAFGGCRLLTADGLSRTYLPTRQDWECISGFEYFLRWGVDLGVPHASALYSRQHALALDFYRFDIISSDWESLRRLVLHGNVLLHGREVSAWRMHGMGASRNMEVQARVIDLCSITEPCAYALSLGLDRVRLDRWQRETQVSYVESFVRICIEIGCLTNAREFLTEIRKSSPSIFRASALKLIRDIPLIGLLVLHLLGGTALTRRVLYLWHRVVWR